MKITVNYGNDVFCVPASVLSKLEKATKRDIRILFALLSSPEVRSNFESNAEKLANMASCSYAELLASVSFWRGTGIIESDEEDIAPVADEEASSHVQEKETVNMEKRAQQATLTDDLPNYSTAELNAILERHKTSAILIDECQNLLGKIFNPHEISSIVALQDYLDLEDEYILILVDHCARHGKKTIHYIKKRAFSLYNEGITSPSVLREHFKKLDSMYMIEGQIRSLFGMTGRELTAKEKKFINTWVCEFNYDFEVIKKAYEITVDATQKPTPAYANAILERWNSEGLRDISAIEAASSSTDSTNGSFDTDDFFEAALKRSFNN